MQQNYPEQSDTAPKRSKSQKKKTWNDPTHLISRQNRHRMTTQQTKNGLSNTSNERQSTDWSPSYHPHHYRHPNTPNECQLTERVWTAFEYVKRVLIDRRSDHFRHSEPPNEPNEWPLPSFWSTKRVSINRTSVNWPNEGELHSFTSNECQSTEQV